ncbi:MAG: 2-thiouracil desulfurase family protein [Gammaproteobacteria bacterium]|nr:2-thiouracil desulfurase family protein [Gammaproteobacteria bacterium]
MSERARIAVSACLAGEKVRYDGADRFTTAVAELESHFELIPICPEVGIGLGVPRQTIGLYHHEGTTRIRQHEQPYLDVTDDLVEFGLCQAGQFLAGLVVKARSPSCGINDAEIRNEAGDVIGSGEGGFIQGIRTASQGIPMINEEDIQQAEKRQAFIEAVQAYASLQGYI